MTSRVTLYWISGSPPSWRVMLGLAVKGITYDSVCLDVSRKQHKSAEYLGINPRGQVPTLVHGDLTIRESVAILAYLDRAFPEKPLFGDSPMAAAPIWQSVMEIDSVLRPPAGQIARSLFRGNATPDLPELVTATAEIAAELERIEADLSDGRNWLCGAGISAADVVLYPTLAWLHRALDRAGIADFAPLRTVGPQLAAWQARMQAEPWFDATYPPHWR